MMGYRHFFPGAREGHNNSRIALEEVGESPENMTSCPNECFNRTRNHAAHELSGNSIIYDPRGFGSD